MTLSPGAPVKIRAISPPGHVRTPSYLRGKQGTVERVLSEFKNPEQLAYSLPAPAKQLYRVRFEMTELWGQDAKPGDTLDAEIYAHWIEEG